MWPGLSHLKQIVEFDDGFELEYNGGSWGTEQSRALELSRDNDSGGCLLEIEFVDCPLCVLLECDDDRLSRLRLLECTEFD